MKLEMLIVTPSGEAGFNEHLAEIMRVKGHGLFDRWITTYRQSVYFWAIKFSILKCINIHFFVL